MQFFSDGYLHVRGAIPPLLIDDALRHINSCVGRGDLDRTIPDPMMVGAIPHKTPHTHLKGAMHTYLSVFRRSNLDGDVNNEQSFFPMQSARSRVGRFHFPPRYCLDIPNA